jgi:hypothetical protein
MRLIFHRRPLSNAFFPKSRAEREIPIVTQRPSALALGHKNFSSPRLIVGIAVPFA